MTAIAKEASIQRGREEEEVTTSCGNVYEDLGLPHPDKRLAKSVMALAITDAIKAQQLTQTAAAEQLGTDCATIIGLQRGCLTHISFDHLISFANALGLNVQITLQVTNNEHGKTSASAL